jgi:hypothetical protein
METLVVEKKVPQSSTYRNDLLKLLAFVLMAVDHIGYMYFPSDIRFRIIGRLAFPIFAYQIALGYSKTSNLKKYTLRLFIFAVITQIPYSFFSPDLKFSAIHFNVLFTFVLAIGLLCVYDMGIFKLKNFIEDRNFNYLLSGIFLLALSVIIIILPEVLSFLIKDFYIEYGMLALALVLLFHIFKEKPAATIISVILFYAFHVYYRVALYNSAYSSSLFWSNLFNLKFEWSKLQFHEGLLHLPSYYFNSWGVFALIPILALERIYKGKIRLNKYVGYIFYPAHMAFIIIIAIILKVNKL